MCVCLFIRGSTARVSNLFKAKGQNLWWDGSWTTCGKENNTKWYTYVPKLL